MATRWLLVKFVAQAFCAAMDRQPFLNLGFLPPQTQAASEGRIFQIHGPGDSERSVVSLFTVSGLAISAMNWAEGGRECHGFLFLGGSIPISK